MANISHLWGGWQPGMRSQGVSLRDAHPDRCLVLPFPLKISGLVLPKQIAPYLQVSMRRRLQASLHLWVARRTDWKGKPFEISQSVRIRLFHSQGIDSAQRDTT